MDLWEIGSLLAIFMLEAGVIMQWWHVVKSGKSDGLSIKAWAVFAATLTYLFVFTVVKDQHWTLIVNYLISSVFHTWTLIMVIRHRRDAICHEKA